MNIESSPQSQAQQLAFTLIELLVVVAIIGILAGLLLPAVTRAKDKSRDILCISNLKQLGIAVRLYADEHNGTLPDAEPLPTMPQNATNARPRLADMLAPYLGYGTNTNTFPQSTTVLRCPKDMVKRFEQNGISYEWTDRYGGRPVDNPRTSQNPISDAVLLFDYENWHSGRGNGTRNALFADFHVQKL